MTSIAVKEKTWEELNRLKKPGDSMDDIIRLLLSAYKDNIDNYEESILSDEQFDQLINELVQDADEFNEYLEKSRQSFSRGV